MTSPPDTSSGLAMSDELPPARLGLRNNLELATADGVESSSHTGDPTPLPDAADSGSRETEDEDKLPYAEDGAGRVFQPADGIAEFSYRVPTGDKSRVNLVVRQGDSAQNLGSVNMRPALQESHSTTYDEYTVGLVVEEIARQYPEKYLFIVLDESETFGSFALPVFYVISDLTSQPDYEEKLISAVNDDPDLKGGITHDDSPWFFEGITKGKESDGDSNSHDRTFGHGPDVGTDNDGGLSIGAKAGIGVGVGVGGLILIGLALFFFLRRRRRRRGAATAGQSLTPANDFVRDKAAHTTQVAESPHSPASDDDNRPRDSEFVAAGRSSAVPTPTSATEEVPHSVAHLVEEGMTHEQIRRLEEEEMALDQAIEQAGRR